MTIKNIVIFLLIGVISWLIIMKIGDEEIHQNAIKDIKTRNEALISKQKESALELLKIRSKLKESAKKIKSIQKNQIPVQYEHAEKIQSMSVISNDSIWSILTKRHLVDCVTGLCD